jgi:hypothetical protein
MALFGNGILHSQSFKLYGLRHHVTQFSQFTVTNNTFINSCIFTSYNEITENIRCLIYTRATWKVTSSGLLPKQAMKKNIIYKKRGRLCQVTATSFYVNTSLRVKRNKSGVLIEHVYCSLLFNINLFRTGL